MIQHTILVTGAAGFIGFHLCERLLKQGHRVVGLDNINDYYNVDLKYARLKELGILRLEAERFDAIISSSVYGDLFQFIRLKIEDRQALPELFKTHQFDSVCNLAAQAGVRYSIENPEAYIDSNVSGFLNILECCRHHKVPRLVYASSSSVYGNSDAVPFEETAVVDQPISLYAATKKSNELMAHSYSHLYNIETIGLRFFTVYGPWGRPDMALGIFAKKIIQNKELHVFNNGKMNRDFTYISDIISGLVSAIEKNYSCEIFNLGNNRSESVIDMIKNLETGLGKKARIKFLTSKGKSKKYLGLVIK